MMRKKIFSIFVLITIVAVYLLLAAIIFQRLESDKEIEIHEQYFKFFQDFKSKNNLTEELMVEISIVHQQTCQLGIPNIKNRKWSFSGSLYFAGTVVTTIGYGHTAPITIPGRIAFILFALTSIPLYMLLLNMLIEVSVTSLTHAYKDICNRFKNKNAAQRRRDIERLQTTGKINVRGVLLLISLALSVFSTSTAAMFAYIEEWSYFEALYFTLVSFTTVGLGDFVPLKETTSNNTHEVYYLLNLVVIILGTIFTYIFLNLLATIYRHLINRLTCSKVAKNMEIKSQENNKPVQRRKFGVSRLNGSIRSANNLDNNAMGSFAAIQRALDRVRNKAEENNYDKVSELKAVNTIEAILKDEFLKIRARQGNDVRSRWQRAAAKARLVNRREKSRRVSFNEKIGASSATINLGVENPDIYQKHKENIANKSPPNRFFRREQTAPGSLATLNIQSFKESNTKFEITQKESLKNSITLQNIFEARLSHPTSRKITSSTYLSTEDENFSPTTTKKMSLERRRRSESQYGYTNTMGHNNNKILTFDEIARQRREQGSNRSSRNSTYFSAGNPFLDQTLSSQHEAASKGTVNNETSNVNSHDNAIILNIQRYDDESSSSYDESGCSDDTYDRPYKINKLPKNNNLHPLTALPKHEADTLYQKYADFEEFSHKRVGYF